MNRSITDQRQNILVLGAGELGTAMLAGLVAESRPYPAVQLSVLLRAASLNDTRPANQARLKQLSDWHVEIITADFSTDDVAALANLFSGYDLVINCSGFVGGTGTQMKISRAVLDAGVAHYIPWQFGVDYDRIGYGSGQPVWDEQLNVRALLRSQHQTRWTIVSTGIFTSFLFEPAFGLVDLEQHQVIALGDADYALTATTPEDIGRLTAKLVFLQPSLQQQVIFVAGDTVTYTTLCDRLSQHYQRPFTLQVVPRDVLAENVRQQPDNVSAAYQLAFARADGVAWDKGESWNVRQGISVTDVKDWLITNKPLA